MNILVTLEEHDIQSLHDLSTLVLKSRKNVGKPLLKKAAACAAITKSLLAKLEHERQAPKPAGPQDPHNILIHHTGR